MRRQGPEPIPGATRRPLRHMAAGTAPDRKEGGRAWQNLACTNDWVACSRSLPWSITSAMRSSRTPSWAKHRRTLSSVSGIPKFMRTLWLCDVAGGPFSFAATKPGSTPLGLEEAHRELRISPEEFDEVAAELGRTLDHFGVPAHEKDEVLTAFAAHKGEVTEGSMASA